MKRKVKKKKKQLYFQSREERSSFSLAAIYFRTYCLSIPNWAFNSSMSLNLRSPRTLESKNTEIVLP